MSDDPTTLETALVEPSTEESAPLWDWRIDLKTIFLCIVAFAIPCRWVAVSSNQQWCVSELEKLNVFSYYDYEQDGWSKRVAPIVERERDSYYIMSGSFRIAPPSPICGYWLGDLGGLDKFHRVNEVHFSRRFITARMLSLISRIGTIEEIGFDACTIEPAHVEALRLLPTLRHINLYRPCEFRGTSLAEMKKALPNCRFEMHGSHIAGPTYIE